MLIDIPALLTAEQVADFRRRLGAAEWIDGRVTAGPQSAAVKKNLQLDERDPEARALGQIILAALERNPLFLSASLAKQVFPPLFNQYRAGMSFGNHVDNAIRQVPGTGMRIRTDISATLFLTPPEDYDGGELIVEDTYGTHAVKLPAGDLVLYPATSLHRVAPIARGVRLAAFFWVQSLVKDDGRRTLLFDMDAAIQQLSRETPGHASIVSLTACYHNLVRQWSEL
jgi:PKHD-type hydroxylase